MNIMTVNATYLDRRKLICGALALAVSAKTSYAQSTPDRDLRLLISRQLLVDYELLYISPEGTPTATRGNTHRGCNKLENTARNLAETKTNLSPTTLSLEGMLAGLEIEPPADLLPRITKNLDLTTGTKEEKKERTYKLLNEMMEELVDKILPAVKSNPVLLNAIQGRKKYSFDCGLS